MDVIEIVGYMLGGLGVFFLGMKMLTTGLRDMTGRRFRLLLGRWMKNGFLAGLWGAIAGALTQTGSVPSFVVASLVNTGMLTVRQGLPTIIWTNVGVTIIVLVAVLNLKGGVLIVLGIGGICYGFEKPARFKRLAQALLGIGLLFYGLILLKAGAIPLSETEWFHQTMVSVQDSLILALVAGVVLTLAVQSGLSTLILAVTLAGAGVLSVDQCLMIQYGAMMGYCIITWILCANIRGSGRQLIMASLLFEFSIPFVFIFLLLVEVYTQIPLLKSILVRLSDKLDQQMAMVPLISYTTLAIVYSFFFNPFANLLKRFWPPTAEEEISKVAYLQDKVLTEHDTSLELLEKEQQRFLANLSQYMVQTRKVSQNKEPHLLEKLHEAFAILISEMEAFTSGLFAQELSVQNTERAVHSQSRLELIVMLEDMSYSLSKKLCDLMASESNRKLAESFLEAMDILLLTAGEAAAGKDQYDVDMLLKLTEDRGESMKRIRGNYLLILDNPDPAVRERIVEVTVLFERAAWIIQRLGIMLRQELRNADSPDMATSPSDQTTP